MAKLQCSIPDWQCENAQIIVRADLNVPIEKKVIVDDLRLRAIQPTLDALIRKKATIILMSHLGRPNGHDPSLSTQQLIPWFKKHSYSITFAPTIPDALQLLSAQTHSIILLENLRFFPGEKKLSISFAQELAQLGSFFVQDAFGALHKKETSITLLPEQFPARARTIGFLVEKELAELTS